MKKKGHHGGHYAATVVPFLYDKGVSLGKLDGCYFAQRNDVLLRRRPAGDEAAGSVLRIHGTPHLEADVLAQAVEVCVGDNVELLVGG